MGLPVSQRYVSATTQVGPQSPINTERLLISQTTIGVFIVSGTAQYSIEGCMDNIMDIQGVANPDARWFTLNDFPQWVAATKYATVFDVWQFLRININQITGQLEFKVNQAVHM